MHKTLTTRSGEHIILPFCHVIRTKGGTVRSAAWDEKLSLTVAVQRHKIKCVWAESRLNSCPRNRGQRTVEARQSTGGRISYISGRWDMLQV